MEATIKSLATKDDLANTDAKIAAVQKDIVESRAEMIRWMFFFAVTQTIATALIFQLARQWMRS